jgi:hypothetical protein
MSEYVKTEWVDHIIDPTNGEVIQEGTRFTASRANNIENGIYNLHDSQSDQDKKIQRLEVELLLRDRSSSGKVFYDPLDGEEPSKLTLDTTKADITQAVSAGATVLPVDSVTGFKVDTEVTIYDDVNQEEVMITAVGTDSVTVSAIANGYKKGAKVARSNVVIDSNLKAMKFNTWGTFTVSVSEVK